MYVTILPLTRSRDGVPAANVQDQSDRAARPVLSELKQHPGTVVLFLLCLSYKQPDYMGDID